MVVEVPAKTPAPKKEAVIRRKFVFPFTKTIGILPSSVGRDTVNTENHHGLWTV